MERYHLQQEQAFYHQYAIELRDKFRAGLLSELRQYPQFVTWKHIEVNGQRKKPPFNPRTGQFADPTNPEHGTDVMTALRALATGRYNGIGFLLTEQDPFTAIDLDDVAYTNRSIDHWAKQAVQYFNSYTEYSPSMTGLHILTKATVPNNGMKKGGIELYSNKRYITLTLNHVPGTPTAIADGQMAVDAVYTHLHPASNTTVSQRPSPVSIGEGQSASYIQAIERGLRHDTTGIFGRLLKGDHTLWEGEAKMFASRSDADFYLAKQLAFWTYGNAEQIDAIFRTPQLYRDKWDERRGNETYGSITIKKALQKRA